MCLQFTNVLYSLLNRHQPPSFPPFLLNTAPPGITMSPSNDLEKLVGQSVNFTCAVSGIPTPTVTWYHNGAQLSAGGVISISGNTLSISSLAVGHTGMYQCFASNVVGRTQRSWALQVRTSGEHTHMHTNATHMYTHTYAHAHTHTHTHTHMHTHTHTHTHTQHTHTHTYTHTNTHTNTHTHMYTHICTRTHTPLYTHTCTHTRTWTHTCTHTHTHAHTRMHTHTHMHTHTIPAFPASLPFSNACSDSHLL